MEARKVGRVKIGKEKIKEHVYPRIRLPTELGTWIDKKVHVYLANIDGQEVILLSADELAIDSEKISQIANDSEQVSQMREFEERLSRLERAIEQIYQIISGGSPGSSSDMGSGRRGWDLNPGAQNGHRLSRPEENGFSAPRKLFNFAEDKEEFREWLMKWTGKVRIYGQALKKKPIAPQTARDYVNKLEKVFNGQDIYSISDIEELVDEAIESGELERGWNHWAKGLRNYMQFLFLKKRIDEKTYYEVVDAFGEIKPTGTRDVDLQNDEIVEAYEHFRQHGNKYDVILYRLLVYSGLRLAHVLEALHNWNPENVKVYGQVAVYRMEAFIKGNKKAFVMLFPAEMLDEIEKFPEEYTYNVARHRINYRRVSAITIRHWFYNFMILDNGVPEGVTNFIQGRTPENVGSANYLAKMRGAIQKYAEIVEKFPI